VIDAQKMADTTTGVHCGAREHGGSASDDAGLWRSHPTSRWPRYIRRSHAFGDDGRAFRRIEPVQYAPVAIPDGDDCVGLAYNLNQDRRNVFPATIDCAYHAVGLVRPLDGEGCRCLCHTARQA
jgi:hypothetical protein